LAALLRAHELVVREGVVVAAKTAGEAREAFRFFGFHDVCATFEEAQSIVWFSHSVQRWDLDARSNVPMIARAICERANRLPEGDHGVFCAVYAYGGDRKVLGIELRERRGGKPVGEPGEGLVWTGRRSPTLQRLIDQREDERTRELMFDLVEAAMKRVEGEDDGPPPSSSPPRVLH
jgi:hypothetical protein